MLFWARGREGDEGGDAAASQGAGRDVPVGAFRTDLAAAVPDSPEVNNKSDSEQKVTIPGFPGPR